MIFKINFIFKGTAAVALAGVLASLKSTGRKLEDNRFLFVGAGQVIFSQKLEAFLL